MMHEYNIYIVKVSKVPIYSAALPFNIEQKYYFLPFNLSYLYH